MAAATKQAADAFAAGKISRKKFDKINNALNAYGTEGDKNGVLVGISPQTLAGSNAGEYGQTDNAVELDYSKNKFRAVSHVTFDFFAITDTKTEKAGVTVVHEGQHVLDGVAIAALFVAHNENYLATRNDPNGITRYQTENNAFHTQSDYYAALGQTDSDWGTWNKGWSEADDKKEAATEGKRQKAIDTVLQNGYGYTRGVNEGGSILRVCDPGKCF
jgi:hypothetical protein